MSLPDNKYLLHWEWASDLQAWLFYANAKLSGSVDVANDNEILSMF